MIAFIRSLFQDEDIDPSPVRWVVIQCPVRWCRGDDCPVIHTEGKQRNHKCRSCGYVFWSSELPRVQPDMEKPTHIGEVI